MVLARMFEEKAAELYTQKRISGFCHLYIGQEAIVVGITKNMQKQDSCITSYRDHAHMLTFGIDPKFVMAELCGKISGCSKGKGGSMHMYCKEKNFYGGNAIVGAQVPLGTGFAFAHKYKNDCSVSVTYFGDGAANQGQVYESFNMASLWSLPVLYVLENNQYAMGTSTQRSAIKDSLKTRGDTFGIETILVDGMDLFDVLEKSKIALDTVRKKSRPVILHVDTYRYRGHSMSDPGTYRTREEINNIKQKRDPIKNMQAKMFESGILPAECAEIDKRVLELIIQAEQFALNSPFPDEKELTSDVVLKDARS